MTGKTMKQAKSDTGRARGVIPITSDDYPFIIGAAIATIGAYCSGWRVVSDMLGALFLFIFNFFHDFAQGTPQDEGAFICPANGKVIAGKTILARQKAEASA